MHHHHGNTLSRIHHDRDTRTLTMTPIGGGYRTHIVQVTSVVHGMHGMIDTVNTIGTSEIHTTTVAIGRYLVRNVLQST